MVFESIVVDVLNRFLGNYVENLNRSQLKLGIWGGDVVLENLILKQNALEELNIPVQTVYGHLGKLVLKIPWKNLYGASVEATVDRLFLIVNPTAEVKYDHEKEEKMALAAKQAELVRVEEAKKQEAQKDESKLDETFVEKLVTQIIKNVQLKITDIHIRYEDSITNPKDPFSFGITLHNLSVHTTDENWQKAVITDAVTKIFKILDLEALAIYWNPTTELYSKAGPLEIKERLQGEIATKSSKPSFYRYALGPINATAKLKLNPKPEGDVPKFSSPKVILSLHMEQLTVSLTKAQYQDMMLLADSMDRMSKQAPYRKYRPNLTSYKRHYKEWWQFAYRCILEEEVRRRRRNWNWTHMLEHRQLCKNYANVYQCKLTNKGKVNAEQLCVLEKAEKTLDLLNLVVIRQRIEMEVERLGKMEEEAKKTRGWFGGWWYGGGSKDDEMAEGTAIMKQFEKAMTPEEKEKLFRAIDYQENSAPLHLPIEYVAIESYFQLDRLQLNVTDEVEVLRASVDHVEVDMKQRPSANALRVDVQMKAFSVTGVQQGDFEPQLVTSKAVTHNVNLLNVVFETKPLDGTCDQRVKVHARPLQIVYDAQTVIEIVNVFKPPTESTALSTLQAVAENKLSDLKEKSALGMQYAVHHHTFIDLDIDIAASYIIVPKTGVYKENEACVVVKLGAIKVKSEPRSQALDVHKLYLEGLADEDILAEIARHSYDKMALELTEMQIVIANPDEDWQSAIATTNDEGTPLHLLQPTNLVIQIHKCLITDDPRLPKIRVIGELQKIAISASEDRLLTLCEILVSMPLPQSDESTQLKPSESKGSSLSLLKYLDPMEKQRRETARAKESKKDEHTVQLTEVEAFFIMKELVLSINRKTQDVSKTYDRFLVFSLSLLEITATQKTFTLEATVKLGAVKLQHHRVGQGLQALDIIETPDIINYDDQSQPSDLAINTHGANHKYLFTVVYRNVDKKCPDFRGVFGSVEQMIELDFTDLRVLLHLQGLREILVIVNEYQTRLQAIQSTVDRTANAGPLETIVEDEEFITAKSKEFTVSVSKPSRRKQVESIQMKVNCKIGAIGIVFATEDRPLSLVKLEGATAGLVLKTSYTQVDCAIASIKVEDLNPYTIHKEILKVLGGDVMNVQIVMYNLEQYPAVSDVNMSIDCQVSCLRIIFLNWFVSSMLDFLNNFQTAQQAIIDASSQAADAARANVQSAYTNSTKLSLKLRLKAPIIIIPENSSSRNAMLVDLGHITLNNKFVDLPLLDVSNKVTVDELTLELDNMKVSCVKLEEDYNESIHERKLLRPTSFKLFVKRSLSLWYESLPDLDISGRMNTIAITIGHSDYKSIMKILNQNLQEGQKIEEKPTAIPKTTSKGGLRGQQSSKSQIKTSVAVAPSKPALKKPRTTIKFSFTMDSLVIDLLNTVSNLPTSEYTMFAQDVELARFCMALLSVKGRMLSDNSMQTSVLLVDCTLDDTRPGRGTKMTRYLERRRSNKGDTSGADPDMETQDKLRSMIDVTYTMKNSDTFIDMRIFSFDLILAMDFLNKIAEFMTTGLAEEPKAKEEGSIIKAVPEKSMDAIMKRRSTAVSTSVNIEPPKLAMMTVNIKIEQPDIILVESLETKECDALVLNMEARFKLRRSAERMVADGGISGLQVVVRTLQAAATARGAPAPPRYLLAPTHLSLALSQPPLSGMHIDLAITDIVITVSPGEFPRHAPAPPRYLLAPTHLSLALSQPPLSGMHIDLAITDIVITVSPGEFPRHAPAPPRYLLAPTHLSLALSQPPLSGMHIDLAITDIVITVSPGEFPRHAPAPPRYLLAPTHLSLALSQPPLSGMHIDLAITDIVITVSPGEFPRHAPAPPRYLLAPTHLSLALSQPPLSGMHIDLAITDIVITVSPGEFPRHAPAPPRYLLAPTHLSLALSQPPLSGMHIDLAITDIVITVSPGEFPRHAPAPPRYLLAPTHLSLALSQPPLSGMHIDLAITDIVITVSPGEFPRHAPAPPRYLLAPTHLSLALSQPPLSGMHIDLAITDIVITVSPGEFPRHAPAPPRYLLAPTHLSLALSQPPLSGMHIDLAITDIVITVSPGEFPRHAPAPPRYLLAPTHLSLALSQPPLSGMHIDLAITDIVITVSPGEFPRHAPAPPRYLLAPTHLSLALSQPPLSGMHIDLAITDIVITVSPGEFPRHAPAPPRYLLAPTHLSLALSQPPLSGMHIDLAITDIVITVSPGEFPRHAPAPPRYLLAPTHLSLALSQPPLSGMHIDLAITDIVITVSPGEFPRHAPAPPRYLLAPTHLSLALSQPPLSGMHIDLAITDIVITVSPGEFPRHAPAPPRYLLAPTHLSLALSQPPLSGMHIDLAITDIVITVSPGEFPRHAPAPPRYLLAPTHLSLALSQPPLSGMHIDLAITDIVITVSPGEFPRHAPAPPRYLLAPTHLSLALSQPPLSGMHIDLAITDIVITVSPDIISLLNRVLATMTSTEEDNKVEEKKAVFYDNLWGIQPFSPNCYWFLKAEEAEEAIDAEDEVEVVTSPPIGEICLLSCPSIVTSFEMEIGNETIPVLVMQASLTGQVKDWSSFFYAESTWVMQVSYYNIERAVWEPLLEPVEVLKDYQYKHVPWELKMEVVMHAQEAQAVIDTTDEAANLKAVAKRHASKTITLSSSEPLEITITRTGMEVLTQLGNSFSTAIAEGGTTTLSKSKDDSHNFHGAPYVLHNCTGLTVKLMLNENHDLSVMLTEDYVASDYREVVLEPGASVPLQMKHGGLNLMKLNEAPLPLKLNVKIVEIDDDVQIPVDRADKRYFPLGRKIVGTNEKNVPLVAAVEPRGLISDVVMQDAALHIYLRSVVQVTNTLSVNVSVYYMTLSGNEVRLLGDVKPGDILRLPLQAVHTPTAELFFSVEGFTVSVSPFIWRELQQQVNISKLLQCESKDKNTGEKFYLQAVGKMEQVFYEHTTRHTFASSCYDIVLKPAVKLQNCLPVEIVVSQLGLKRTQVLKPGEMFHLSHLSPYRASIVIMIQNYLDKCWVCTKNLPESETELSVWSFESHDSPSVMTLDLGMHSVDTEGTQVLSLYCPFWMLNKTGFTLCYRKSKKPEKDSSTPNKNVDETGNVIFHPKDYKEPILFSFRAKNFFGKKKAAIRLEFGEWSDKFSLDVPGSSGVIQCKHEGRTYQVAVTNQLTFNSLTKMVIFTPYFLIINEAPFDIQYQELHRSGDPWINVAQNSSAPLWPVIERDDKLLLLRVASSSKHSAPFLYTEHHSVCLKLDDEFGGLFVEVQLTEGGTYITIRQYRDGHAPALLVNYTPHSSITIYEKENVNTRVLESMHRMLYTWDNPAGPRMLIFEGHKRKEVENDLRKDGIGDFMISETERIYWVSFLDGLQRVILFTDDPILASGAHTIGEAELVDTELVLSMQGIGLSLVNDPEQLEIIYISISNSGIIWEQCKLGSRRYKKVDGPKLLQLEESYQRYLSEKIVSDEPVSPRVQIDDKLEVDFEEMRQLKPTNRLLRRTLQPGLWASYGLTPHSRRLHARLYRLQIDQQLPLPTFPVVLAPVPPPRSIASEDPSGMKPFIEVSIVERIMEHSKVRQYKYYKVLIQEFHVKVDMGLINALLGMFPQRLLNEQEALDAFQLDLKIARQPLEALAAMGVASDLKNFYDNLHLSPLKVHVSFSLGGATQLPSFIGTILQSIGVTLTDMNDVVFKLSYYERNYEFLSQKELISEVQNHYTGQALKQLYVLVLGLDVIGNPYGLVIGLKKGVEDLFYEPFQGAIQGPGEFAEGLFLGVRSLVGHTVGGAAGAVSRITGAMGHGLAALSLDKDYQRRRRDNINKPPANLQEGLARSGKGLVMGVVDGVTGVFTKPIEGAREQGVEGFFRGLGKGAVGLVARPTAGVVDFASGSLDAVKRAADMSEEVTKRRPARYMAPDSGVKPYSRLHAEGYKMLFELEKGKYVSTDRYEAHVWVIAGKEVVMCTDKRMLYIEKNNVFGGWQILWTYLWSELPEVPTAVNKGVYVPTAKRKVLGMFPTSGSGKVIFLYDEQQKKYLLAQCQRLMQGR